MASAVGKYLNDIDGGVPINLDAFHGMLKANGLIHYASGHDIVLLSREKGKYVLHISDELRFELDKFRQSTGVSRAEAALSGESHSARVNGSFLIAKRYARHPFVVLFEEDGAYTLPDERISKIALVIENRQCFLQAEKLIDNLCSREIGLDATIIFGAGNEVSNRLHSQFFNCFENVFYFLDVDVGGLKIAQNIKAISAESSVHHFILPEKTESLMALMSAKGQLTAKEKSRIIDIGKSTPFLLHACNLLLKTGRKVEQESHLFT